MRKDNSKVIAARPRRSGWTKVVGLAPKDLADTAALRRFLEGQVGRPWDQVLGEVTAIAKRGGPPLAEVLERLDEVIARRVAATPATAAFPCGLVRTDGKLGRRAPVPPGAIYLDPRDGRVRLARRRYFDRQTGAEVRFHRINEGEVAVRLDGVWHAVKVRPFRPAPGETMEDVLIGEVSAGDAARLRDRYGAEVLGQSKRPLSSRELRNLGLANEAGRT